MKKTLLIIIGVNLLLFVVCLLLVEQYYGNKLDDQETENAGQITLLEQGIRNSLLVYDFPLDLSLEEATFLDKEGNAIPKDSLSDMLPKLIFRFQTHMCDLCIDSQLEVINRFTNNADFIMLLPSFHDSRSRKIYHSNIRDSIRIMELKENPESLKFIEELDYPYYFILNKDFTLSHFFIPVNGLSDFSHQYINMMSYHLIH